MDDNMKIIRIGRVELTEDDARRLYEAGKYILTYSKIYAVCYSENAGCYGHEVYRTVTKGKGGMCLRGRWHALSAADVNHLLGYKLLNE